MYTVLKIAILSCIVTFSRSLLLNDGLCRHGWYHFRDRCYMFAKDKETWTNAEFKCRVFGGHLAEIHDAETNEFIKDRLLKENSFAQGHHFYIGLTDEAQLNVWEWVESRTTLNYTDWGTKPHQQPDHFRNGEHCVLLYANDGYAWHDADCHHMNQFICEEEETDVNIIG